MLWTDVCKLYRPESVSLASLTRQQLLHAGFRSHGRRSLAHELFMNTYIVGHGYYYIDTKSVTANTPISKTATVK